MLIIMLLPACTSSDRRSVFLPDTAADHLQEQEDHFELPLLHQPLMANRPDLSLSPSEGPLKLSIEDTVLLVLSNNRDLWIQQLAPAVTGTFEQIERGRYDPEFFAESMYARELDTETSNDDTTAGAAGIRQILPGGTALETTLAHKKDTGEANSEKNHTRLGLTITQALLRGAGPMVDLARIQQREMDTLAGIYELQGFTEALVAETEIAYWNYVLALKEIDIFQSSLAVAIQQKNNAEQQILVGLLPENDAAAVRAEVAIREQALINAGNLVEEQHLKLLQLINVGTLESLNIEIDATSDPVMDTIPLTDRSERIQLAVKARPDLNEARLRLQQGRLEVMVTKNGLLPKIEFFMDLGINGYGRNMASSVPDMSKDVYDLGMGVRLSHYSGNRAAKANHMAAKLFHRKSRAAIDNLEYQIFYDVSLAVNEIERNRRQIQASKTTRQFEEQTLRAEQERFNVGIGTTLMVAQAQRDLLESQIAEARAVINYRIALVRLYLAEGSLLQRRGVSISKPEKTQ